MGRLFVAASRLASLTTLLLMLATLAGAATLDVKVEGGDKTLRQNISLHLSNLDSREQLQPRRLEARVIKLTQKALNALGYYDAEVSVAGIAKGGKKITVTIVEGKPIKWEQPDIQLTGEGQNDPLLLQWMEKQAPKPGDRLNHASYDNFKKGLLRLSLQEGYFDATFPRAELRVDRDRHKANMLLTLDTASRYYFGKVVLDGTRIEQDRLQRFVTFKPGDPYQESKVTEVYKALLDSGYFKDLAVKPDRDKIQNHSVPVAINLEDDRAHRFNVGAGYGTDSGVRTKFQWSKPVINDYGHSTGAIAKVTEIEKSVELDYKIPDGHPAKDYYLGQASFIDQLIDENPVKTTVFTVSHNHEFNNGWVENLFTKLSQEVNTEQVSNAFFVTPGVAYSQLELKGKPIPREGHRYLVDAEFSDPKFGSDTQFTKVHALAKWLVPLSSHQQMLFKIEGGSIQAQDFNKVPLTTRFFAGGDQSIRGYDYQTLGPADDKGDAQGARYLTIGGSEYLWQFADRWQWALFVDHGRVFDNNDEPYRTGAGMGIRWLSPVGNVRFDVASRVNDEKNGFRIHIFMGPPL